MGLHYDFAMTNQILSKWRVVDSQATNKMDTIYKKELLIFYVKNILSSSVNKN